MWLFEKYYLFCCVIVLPSIVTSFRTHLDQMARNNDTINDVFELVPGGFLGDGGYCVVYKGIRISDRRPVALKFSPKEYEKLTDQEYTIFTYLEAIDRPEVEQFGIPVIYYYGEFMSGTCNVMALSLLEEDLFSKLESGKFVKNPINSLILLKQFIVTTKYLHSHGCRHDDIKPENIMFRGDRSFLIDYNLSSKIMQKKFGGSISFASRKAYTRELRTAMDDFESFLYVLAEANYVRLKFLPTMGFDTSNRASFQEAKQMKLKVNDTITEIKSAIRSPHLRRVLVAFAEHVLLSDKAFPDYDFLYQMVQDEIQLMVKPIPAHLAFFTWLKPNEIAAAKADMAKHPSPDLENALIRMPQFIDFTKYPYPKPNFNKFGGFGLVKMVSRHFQGQ